MSFPGSYEPSPFRPPAENTRKQRKERYIAKGPTNIPVPSSRGKDDEDDNRSFIDPLGENEDYHASLQEHSLPPSRSTEQESQADEESANPATVHLPWEELRDFQSSVEAYIRSPGRFTDVRINFPTAQPSHTFGREHSQARQELSDRVKELLNIGQEAFKRDIRASRYLTRTERVTFKRELNQLATVLTNVSAYQTPNGYVAYSANPDYVYGLENMLRSIENEYLRGTPLAERFYRFPVWGPAGRAVEYWLPNEFEVICACYRTEVETFLVRASEILHARQETERTPRYTMEEKGKGKDPQERPLSPVNAGPAHTPFDTESEHIETPNLVYQQAEEFTPNLRAEQSRNPFRDVSPNPVTSISHHLSQNHGRDNGLGIQASDNQKSSYGTRTHSRAVSTPRSNMRSTGYPETTYASNRARFPPTTPAAPIHSTRFETRPYAHEEFANYRGESFVPSRQPFGPHGELDKRPFDRTTNRPEHPETNSRSQARSTRTTAPPPSASHVPGPYSTTFEPTNTVPPSASHVAHNANPLSMVSNLPRTFRAPIYGHTRDNTTSRRMTQMLAPTFPHLAANGQPQFASAPAPDGGQGPPDGDDDNGGGGRRPLPTGRPSGRNPFRTIPSSDANGPREPQFDIKFRVNIIPEWDGNTDELSRWILKINRLAKQSVVMYAQLGTLVPTRFTGLAEQWYYSLSIETREHLEQNWDILREAICDYFMNRSWLDKQKNRANKAKYREFGHGRETPSEYFIRKLDLLQRVYDYNDREMINEIISGAPTQWIPLLTPHLLTYLEELQANIKYFEDVLIQFDHPRTNDPSAESRNPNSRNPFNSYRKQFARTNLGETSPEKKSILKL